MYPVTSKYPWSLLQLLATVVQLKKPKKSCNHFHTNDRCFKWLLHNIFYLVFTLLGHTSLCAFSTWVSNRDTACGCSFMANTLFILKYQSVSEAELLPVILSVFFSFILRQTQTALKSFERERKPGLLCVEHKDNALPWAGVCWLICILSYCLQKELQELLHSYIVTVMGKTLSLTFLWLVMM